MKVHCAMAFGLFFALLAAVPILPAQPVNPLAGGEDQAVVPTYTVSPNTSALLLMPELKNATAPTWVKPGLRITMNHIDGTINNNPINGNHGGAGQGIEQVDILSVQRNAVVLNSTSRLVANNSMTVTTIVGSVTTPGDANDLWITPDVFQKYMNLNEKGFTSNRTEYKTAGKAYNAMWQNVAGAGSTSTYVHDIDSGLLLHTALDATNNNQRFIAQSTFIGMRELKVPWTQGRMPRLLDGIHQLTYDGQVNTVIPGLMPVPPISFRMTMKIVGRGSDFLQIEKSTLSPMAGNFPQEAPVPIVTGCAQLLPLAIEPADFAKLQQGQELDTDPDTHIVTTVAFIGRDQRGKDVVVITAKPPGDNDQRVDTLFDRNSGLMTGFSFTNPTLHQLTRVTLVKTE